MFAGPNGSGKSTLKTVLPQELIGVYINPDEIESEIRTTGRICVKDYGIVMDSGLDAEILAFFQHSPFLKSQGLTTSVQQLSVANGELDFSRIAMNSYIASVVSECLRQQLLRQ
jgi:hypothetical protein